MRIKNIVTPIVASLLALLLSSPALAFPPLPSSFYGAVKANGSNVPDGTLVRALIDGKAYAEARTLTYEGASVYVLDVPGEDSESEGIQGGQPNSAIHFEVGGLLASTTGAWQSGTNVELNLTVSGTNLATPLPQATPTPTRAPDATQPSIVILASPTPQPGATTAPAPTVMPQPTQVTTSDQPPAPTTVSAPTPATDTQATVSPAQPAATNAAPSAEQPSPTPQAIAQASATVQPVEVSNAIQQGSAATPAMTAPTPAASTQSLAPTASPVNDGTNSTNDFWLKASIAIMIATVAGVLWLVVRRR